MFYDSLVPEESMYIWYIYVHLVDFYGKFRYTYHTWILWGRGLGSKITSPNLISVGEFSCHGYPLALQKTLTSSLPNPGEHRGAEQVWFVDVNFATFNICSCDFLQQTIDIYLFFLWKQIQH